MYKDMFWYEPIIIIVTLMLALVEKPMMTWTRMNMLLMLMNVTNNPMEKGIRQLVHKQKLVSKFCNLLQGPTKLVMSRV